MSTERAGGSREEFERWKRQIREKGGVRPLGGVSPELHSLLTRMVSFSELMGEFEETVAFTETHRRSDLDLEGVERLIAAESATARGPSGQEFSAAP